MKFKSVFCWAHCLSMKVLLLLLLLLLEHSKLASCFGTDKSFWNSAGDLRELKQEGVKAIVSLNEG
jgi:hypothetical protein